MHTRTIEVLRHDPDLAVGLSAEELGHARRQCVAGLSRIEKGEASLGASADSGGIGLLVISGHLVRRVRRGGRFGAELLGPGDLLRPWQMNWHSSSLAAEPLWTAITPMEVASLDMDFARRAAPFPTVGIQLSERAMLRSRNLAIAMAIVHQPRIDRRLHLLLWHYADRWGKVGASGTTLDIPLTHGILAELLGARRPTVSTALGRLAEENKVQRQAGRWHLIGGPPGELEELETHPERQPTA